MPNLLTPGVYIQEVAFGPSPISGVSTSVAGFAGEAERGLVNGPPSLVTSFADFQRQFGNFVTGKYLAYAVQGFFDNGGQQAFIARVADPAAAHASVVPQLGYDAAILSFSAVSAPLAAPPNPPTVAFTIRASTVVGVGDGAVIELINRAGTPVATLTVANGGVNTTAGTLVVTSNVALGTPPLSPSSFALRYAPLPIAQVGAPFTFTARDPGLFGNNLRVRLTPAYLATALVRGVNSATSYLVSTIAPFAVGSFVELANATTPSGREIEQINAIDATSNTITLSGGTTTFALGDFVRALGWKLEVFYNGALVETLTGITSNNGGSDGLSSINASSQWVRVSGTYPIPNLIPPSGHASANGLVNLNTTPTLYGAAGTLSGTTLTVATDAVLPFTVTFTPFPTNAADVLNAINTAVGNGGAIVASQNAAGQLVLTTSATGLSTRLILVSGNALPLLGLFSPEPITGTVDLTTPALYGGGGTLAGKTLILQTDTVAAFTVTFTPAPASAADVLLDITSAVGNGGHVVASENAANQLVLTSGSNSTALLIVGGTAVAVLGLDTEITSEPEALYPFFPLGASIGLAGGTDGAGANETAIIGTDTPPRSGLKTLEATDGISIIAAPGWVSGGHGNLNDAVVGELIGQSERKKDRVAVFETIDGPTVDVNALLHERGKWNSQYAAMYTPWLTILDPLTNTPIPVPPSGHVIGQYANTDNLRGVFKSPANVVLQNILGFSRDIPTGEQDLLNPAGVNVLRNFPGLGNVIWGARTIAADPLWKYVSVRRLFIFLEQSIILGTRYAVFEPNDLKLWARLRDSVKNFLTTQWRAGALFGAAPKEAFFVRVDETTTTQDDRDNGIVNILVGLAPVKPAEFIVFQIGQAPASVIIAEQGA